MCGGQVVTRAKCCVVYAIYLAHDYREPFAVYSSSHYIYIRRGFIARQMRHFT